MNQILTDIVNKKEAFVNCSGFDYGEVIPKERNQPLVLPKLDTNILICEIKRSSPSQGQMNTIVDPVKMAEEYIINGANAISVLTENHFFNGSLNDLVQIKSHLPNIPVLRKDFLLYPEDIDISFKAGADMVLLIASLFVDMTHGFDRMMEMYNKIKALGMLPLVEIHDERDYSFVKSLKAPLIGINSRDLETFKLNQAKPHALRHMIQETTVIFESGINDFNDAFFPGISNFSGLLVGSSIVKSNTPGEKIKTINEGFALGKNRQSDFYRKLVHRFYFEKKPVIKVCGITNGDDLQKLTDVGCDIVGFILAKSPRQINLFQLQQLSQQVHEQTLKVGVVTPDCIEIGVQAFKTGLVDTLQVHGLTGFCSDHNDYPVQACWYEAKQVSTKADLDQPLTPFVLYDAFETGKYGGTGKRISDKLVKLIEDRHDLYGLAGGITPENVRSIIDTFSPSLIDVCSGLEKSPGKKDAKKIEAFFNTVHGKGGR